MSTAKQAHYPLIIFSFRKFVKAQIAADLLRIGSDSSYAYLAARGEPSLRISALLLVFRLA